MLYLLADSSFYTITTSTPLESQLQKSERIHLHHTIQITLTFQDHQEHLGEVDDLLLDPYIIYLKHGSQNQSHALCELYQSHLSILIFRAWLLCHKLLIFLSQLVLKHLAFTLLKLHQIFLLFIML